MKKYILISLAFLLSVLSAVVHIYESHLYWLQAEPGILILITGACIAFVSVLMNETESRLPYIILVFCLVMLAIKTLPAMQCDVDTDSIARSIDSLASGIPNR